MCLLNSELYHYQDRVFHVSKKTIANGLKYFFPVIDIDFCCHCAAFNVSIYNHTCAIWYARHKEEMAIVGDVIACVYAEMYANACGVKFINWYSIREFNNLKYWSYIQRKQESKQKPSVHAVR